MQQQVRTHWKKQFSRFVETRASKAIFKRMKDEQCVIISGPFGCGKSSLAFHTALKLKETLGFDFMIISNPEDIVRYASENKHQLLIIDDAFGKYNVSEYNTMWWNRQAESIYQLVTSNPNLRLLITSRLNIYRSLDLPQLKDRFCLLNLISKELAMSYEERQMIGRCYLQDDIFDKLGEDVVMSYSFFPMLCGMFNIYSNEHIVEYFTNPVECITTDIQNSNKTSHDMFYLALAVLVLFDNNVHKDIFNDNNYRYDRVLTTVSKEIGYKRYFSKKSLHLSFIALTDSYVSDQDTHFACLHRNLFKALASCIGPKIIQYTYFERNLLDMKKASHNIFIGSQHLSAEFRESYIAYMKKHLTKKDLRKDINATTVLHFVSAEGYADYVEFFLELDNQMLKEQDNTGQTALHKTCTKGHLHVARLLLDNGTYIDQSDNYSNTALDLACECGLIDMADLLLSRHARIRQKQTDLRSPLHVACNQSNFKIAELLLKNKAKVNTQDYEGYTPLHLACKKGYYVIAFLLITYKANVNIDDINGKTSLYMACKNGHLKVAALLLLNKANSNQGDGLKNTPILIACAMKHIEIIRLLLKYKADVNCKNNSLLTPLHVACRNNNIDIVLLLIKHGALINEPDLNVQTPLFFACSEHYLIIMGKMIKPGASISTSQNDETHVHIDDKERNEEIAKVLLNAGANVNQGDTYGITPIHLACKAQREDIVKLLINAGVDVNKADNKGITPLDIAREGERNQILSLMLNANGNVHNSDRPLTPPLHMACKQGSEAVVKTLLDAGTNVNEMDSDGLTPLHVACIEGNITILKTLLNAGANVNEMDTDGLTPLHLACKGGHGEIVHMLINVSVNVNKGDKNGVTPLHMACVKGNGAIVKTLLNSVANVDMMNKDGMTALDVACKHDHNDIVSLLLYTGAHGDRG